MARAADAEGRTCSMPNREISRAPILGALVRRYKPDYRVMFETSFPGVFAVGDVRYRSTKRVASAVGEGPVVVQQVHRYLSGDGEALALPREDLPQPETPYHAYQGSSSSGL